MKNSLFLFFYFLSLCLIMCCTNDQLAGTATDTGNTIEIVSVNINTIDTLPIEKQKVSIQIDSVKSDSNSQVNIVGGDTIRTGIIESGKVLSGIHYFEMVALTQTPNCDMSQAKTFLSLKIPQTTEIQLTIAQNYKGTLCTQTYKPNSLQFYTIPLYRTDSLHIQFSKNDLDNPSLKWISDNVNIDLRINWTPAPFVLKP
jgi:hypothetical protein